MYKKILFCLDNSDDANAGIDLGLAVASACGASVAGCHIYAARLHNDRFRQMEGGLPARYRTEEGIKRQREVHDTLITRGLKIISDSYAAPFLAKARAFGLDSSGVSREGKNFEELTDEAREGGYDLAVLGAHGLGRVRTSRVGSVCERVVRRAASDVLVARANAPDGGDAPIAVAMDGSPASFGGLKAACSLSRALGHPVTAVASFDPDFHHTAFRAIAGVLTEEAGRIFKFNEQERLHEEIIDKGLARIYRDHLDTAVSLGAEAGVAVTPVLLSGKASQSLIEYAQRTPPFLLVLGKTGAHASRSLDIGSVTENCLRETACNLLISTRAFTPAPKARAQGPEWSEEASRILDRIPAFARGVVRNMVEDAARGQHIDEITAEFMRKTREKLDG
ncbi:MAG: universal stress protein [Thermodesulfobacteriota bacterium]